jgi:hypothetical protein
MMLSCYFEDMIKAYQAELEDLQNDSDGNDVLGARLADKRSQFALMLPMIDSAPEMVAVAFHGGIDFVSKAALTMLATREPEEFPEWKEVSDAVQFSDWAFKLATAVRKEPGGERFLIVSVCLEYLYQTTHGSYQGDYYAPSDNTDDAPEGVERDDDDEHDLEAEGADWLADQGFDRLG